MVSVVFADIVGFTGFSEGRDPEAVKNLVDVCFDRLAADVHTFGGRVDKVMGDGILAVFGAPVAHEDDAERAVRAALQMQGSVADLATEVRVPIEVRIGVNTGEVLMGAIRAGADYTAMGDVVNTASRLQTMARPGQVLVGAPTEAATRDVIRYETLGPLALRGRDERLATFVALEVTALPGYRPRRSAAPLVGRESEMDVLRHSLTLSFRHRRAMLALLTGDAGLGKQRVAEELAEIAALEHGSTVLVGRCVPYGEATGWWPIAETIRQACGVGPGDDPDVVDRKVREAVVASLGEPADDPAVASLVPGLKYLVGDHASLADLEPARARSEASRAALTFYEAMASQWPLTIVLCELHWADEVVLEFLDRLFERLGSYPFAFVATSRPGLKERWTPTPGRANVIALQLDPLDRQGVAALLTGLLGREPVPELVELMLERTGGNPFFLEEVVGLLDDAGLIEAVARGDVAAARGLTNLPATLRGLVTARIDGLGRLERDVLDDAAVVGAHGDLAALVALGRARGQLDVTGVLDRLARRELLVVDGPEFRFRSDLVRDVAYETLTKADRARRHSHVGAHLAERAAAAGRDDDVILPMAHHYGTAAELVRELGGVDGLTGLRELSSDAFRRASAYTSDRDDVMAAMPVLDQALRLMDLDNPHRAGVLLRRGKALTALGQSAAARVDLEEARARCEASGDPRSLAAVLTAQGELARRDLHTDEALELLDAAIGLWRDTGDDAGLAEALRNRGMTLMFSGHSIDAELSIREALEISRALGDRRGIAWALQNLTWLGFLKGDTSESEGWLDESAALFAEIGDWYGFGWALGMLAWVRFYQGRLDEAEELCERLMPHLRESGDRWAAAMMTVLKASLSLWRGEVEQAVDLAEDARRGFDAIDDRWGRTQALAVLVRSLTMCGRSSDGQRALGELLAEAEGLADLRVFTVLVAAATHMHVGDPERALEAIATGRAIGPEQFWEPGMEADSFELYALLQSGRLDAAVTLESEVAKALDPSTANESVRAASLGARALVLTAAGELARVDELLAEAAALDVGTFLDRARMTVVEGLVAAVRGDRARCTERFGQAQAVVDATDDRLDQALVSLAYGLALASLGAPDADDHLVYARTRLAGVGLSAAGWERAFSLALEGGRVQAPGS